MTSGNFRTLLLGSFVALLSGCGSDGPTKPKVDSSPTPPPPVTDVIREGSGSLGVLMLGSLSFNSPRAGKIDVIVDWTYTTNDVDVYLAKGSCTFDQFIGRQCNVVAFSESTIAKPERITAANAGAGDYTLLIGNVGPTEESLSFQVLLTSTPGASSSAAKAGEQPKLEKSRLREAVRLR